MLDRPPLSTVQAGKFVGGHLYLHTSALALLPDAWRALVDQAAQFAELVIDTHFNVVKLQADDDALSLLQYRDFFDDPFPALSRSWRISLSTKHAVYRTYEESRNPPILHRKELLLAPDDERRQEYALLTAAAEAIGLFADTKSIGFREQWFDLIADRGYTLTQGQLTPFANAEPAPQEDDVAGNAIRRHLTALSRSNFSAPVQALLRHGLINQSTVFSDYGCGRGDDVRALQANGIGATGWDPHYAPTAAKEIGTVANIGFVINVIEHLEERIDALLGAFACTTGVLSVAAMLTSQSPPDGKPYKDGYLSSRNTFQKYFSQMQLRDFIEHTLDTSAIAVGPGVFLVFKDKELEQRFLTAKYGRRKATLNRGWIHERATRPAKEPRSPRTPREPRVRLDRNTQLFLEFQPAFQQLWQTCLALGRMPERLEVDPALLSTLETSVGSFNKALKTATIHFDPTELEQASNAKTSDLLVFGALQQFQKRTAYSHLDRALQTNLRHFFGDYGKSQAAARHVLFKIGNLEEIDAACRIAADKGYGYLDDGHSLQLHATNLERLPTLLRVYVACATVLCGDIPEFDLIKIHIRSGKVTLSRFDNFENKALPRLIQRVKVNLRDQDLDVFEYGTEYAPTLLYNKSRYINEEFPHYSEQEQFEDQLNALNCHDLSGFGPPAEKFYYQLELARWQVDGFSLTRSTNIPNLDQPCGAHFTYRDFVECGETQARTEIANLPKAADSYTALYELAVSILDPVIDFYGMIKLTYGFCSSELSKKIPARIAPELDQHAAYEIKRGGKFICDRLGAACDFLVEDENMEEVAMWIRANTPVDRIYLYGPDRPLHVSYSLKPIGQIVQMVPTTSGRLVPRVIKQ